MAQGLPSPASGLDSLSITAIQNRIAASPLVQRYQAQLAQATQQVQSQNRWGGGAGQVQLQPPFDQLLQLQLGAVPSLTPAEIATIQALAQNPSSQDLEDLKTIDGFFGVLPAGNVEQAPQAFTLELCAIMNGRSVFTGGFGNQRVTSLSAAQAIGTWMNYRPQGGGGGLFAASNPNVSQDDIDAVRKNSFYCQAPAEFPKVVYGLDPNDYFEWFGISPNQTWGQAKLQVQNAITVMNVAAGYPFPPPIDLENNAPFWILSIGDIREIVQTPQPVDPEVVRYWITLQILANYSAWVDRIEKDQKKKAKRARRKAIMTAVGLAVASIVAAFILPAVIALVVSAIKTAVTIYVDEQKRKEAAKQMADAAKMFETDAPGFSKEVDRTANLLDEKAAQDQAAKPPSPELQSAIQEAKADSPGPGVGTILPVGGGIAAAGLAAFLIFR